MRGCVGQLACMRLCVCEVLCASLCVKLCVCEVACMRLFA